MTKPGDLISFSTVGCGINHRDGDLGINWDVIVERGDITRREAKQGPDRSLNLVCRNAPCRSTELACMMHDACHGHVVSQEGHICC